MMLTIAILLGVLAAANVWVWIVQPILDKRKQRKQTMMTDSAIIAVVQAHAEGKKIQCNYKKRANIDWWDVKCPNWDFSEYDFRVAPEPRQPREWYVPEHFLRGSNEVYDSARVKMVHVREVIGGSNENSPDMIYCP